VLSRRSRKGRGVAFLDRARSHLVRNGEVTGEDSFGRSVAVAPKSGKALGDRGVDERAFELVNARAMPMTLVGQIVTEVGKVLAAGAVATEFAADGGAVPLQGAADAGRAESL
jgi:hypothetical protein